LFYADKGFVVPLISDRNYLKTICSICKQEEINILLPSKDTELSLFAKNIQIFNTIQVAVSSYATILLCEDKFVFYHKMKSVFKQPRTVLIDDLGLKFLRYPCVIKERGVGIETSGFRICSSPEKVIAIKHNFKQPIVQEKIEGTEYTVDALYDKHSNPIVFVPRIRLKTRENVSDVGIVVKNDVLKTNCEKAGRILKLTGPANLQWIKKNRSYYLLEVNPRISGGLQITLAACPQFVTTMLKMLLDIRPDKPGIKHSILSMKYDSIISTRLHIVKK
jgi:carbamoyl-phosphate synthase large subunit